MTTWIRLTSRTLSGANRIDRQAEWAWVSAIVPTQLPLAGCLRSAEGAGPPSRCLCRMSLVRVASP